MPKAMVKFDLPESCSNCILVDDVAGLGMLYRCRLTDEYCPDIGRRPNCPLEVIKEGDEDLE